MYVWYTNSAKIISNARLNNFVTTETNEIKDAQ